MQESFYPTHEAPGRILVSKGVHLELAALEQELQMAPFQLTLACGAAEAFENCTFQPFEGILLDYGLSGLSSADLCHPIRDGELNAQTPVIFLTPHALEEADVAGCLRAGAMDCLAWPGAPSDLLAKLRMMVRISRQQRSLRLAERQRALLEIAGGAALEISPYLQDAQAMIGDWREGLEAPTALALKELAHCLEQIHSVLAQIQNLHTYVTKSHGPTQVLDLAGSSQGTLPLERRP